MGVFQSAPKAALAALLWISGSQMAIQAFQFRPSAEVSSPSRGRLAFTASRLQESASSSSEGDAGAATIDEWKDQDIYQRVFYRFTPGSDVDIPNAIAVEERCRFTADPQRPGYILPVGRRTLILRDGQVEDGEIGDDFFTLSVEDNHEKVHNGAGNDLQLQSAVACAMYLACNPTLCQGEMLEVACDLGLASLLGCIGAGFASKSADAYNQGEDGVADDILTISKGSSGLFPKDLDMLVISDSDEVRLNTAFHNLKHSAVPASRVDMQVLDWRIRHVRPRGLVPLKEYRTVVASDVAFTYPEAKELARAVANRLQPNFATRPPLPTFAHVCPEDRDDMPYLRRILEKGYRMSVQTHYLKVEKLLFHFQKLPVGTPEAALDDLELEVRDFKEIKFQSLTAQHHPEYAGEGSGELFFPIETGEYEVTGGSTFLEKEAGADPW